MKIGIDARMIDKTGIGRYIKNLILELEKIDTVNDYIIFLDKSTSNEYHPSNQKFKKWIVNCPIYSIQEQTLFLSELLRARLDLLHVPQFNVPYLYNRKFVVTIHDFTMSSKNFETSTKSSNMYEIKFRAQKLVLGHAIKKASMIIVPSNEIKKQVIQTYKIQDNKITTTYEGVQTNLTSLVSSDMKSIKIGLEKYKVRGNYFLYVGNAFPHKNLQTLIVSHKDNISSGRTQAQVILAGKNDLFYQRVAGFVNGLKLNNTFIFATRFVDKNYISDSEIALLYKGATAYVNPSLNEGFSITPLESQAFGVPVLLSDIPVHREIFGESALYFDPKSTLDLSEKLLRIENDHELRESLVKLGLENFARFSWEKMAKETLEVYNGAIKS